MCPVTFTTLAAGYMGATAAAVVGTAVSGALIGMGATAAMNLATGQSITSGLGKGALFGAISGGISGGLSPASFTGIGATGTLGLSGVQGLGYAGMLAPGAASIAISGAAGSLMTAMTSNVGYTPAAQVSQQQQIRALNMNTNIATTGSGGRQAATSLAAAISRTKKRKLTQDDVGDLSLDTSSFTNTGLQLA